MILLIHQIGVLIEKELQSFYQKYGKDGVVTWQQANKWVDNKDHRRRITALLLILSQHLDGLLVKLNPKFDVFLTRIIDKESDFFGIDLNADDILDTPWGVDNSTWFNRLSDDVDLWKIYIANDLKRAFIRQDNVEDVIEQLNKRFTTIENVVQKLAMTESTAMGSLARRKIFKELGVKKYRYYAREDERRCDVCGSLHGLEFPISAYEIGVTASPMHPWCRCWEVPILE